MDFIEYEMLNPNQIENEDLQAIIEIFQQAFGRARRNEVDWYLSRGYRLIVSRDRRTGMLVAVLLYKTFQRLKSVNIGYIAVEEKYRGRGIGSKLLEILIEELIGKGELEFEVVDSVPHCVNLYRMRYNRIAWFCFTHFVPYFCLYKTLNNFCLLYTSPSPRDRG